MDCERQREALVDVAAGAPAGPELEAHLVACEACRAELDGLRRALVVADTALGELLSAEPSPGLRARIRQAAAEDAGGDRVWAGWRLGWAAALAASVLAVGLLMTSRPGSRGAGAPSREAAVQKTPSPPDPAGAEARLPAPAVASPETPPEVAGRRAGAPSGTVRRSPGPLERAASEPEVLVPPGGAEALVRFASQLHTRGIPPDSLLVVDLSGPLTEPRPVEVKPLEIVPLDPAEGSGT